MPLSTGIAILAVAVGLGGLAALSGDAGRRSMPFLRAFAVVAAVAIAVLHLLPEAVERAGPLALAGALLGFGVPAVLERAFSHKHEHEHHAPTTALAIGYAAVLAHQAGEGAALATLARAGALTPSIVIAIAAHTVPLAMVIAIRVLEARGGHGSIALALGGVALASAAGAVIGSAEMAGLASVEPWIWAIVAGLLLHALVHDGSQPKDRAATPARRIGDFVAAAAGLGLAAFGVENDSWIGRLPWSVRVGAIAVCAAGFALRSVIRRRGMEPASPKRS